LLRFCRWVVAAGSNIQCAKRPPCRAWFADVLQCCSYTPGCVSMRPVTTHSGCCRCHACIHRQILRP
jgi:hypothetical protein